MALDAKLRLKQARAERYKSSDGKRKKLLEELEEAELRSKKVRVETQQEEHKRWHETEHIKEEGRRLREEKERELKKMEENSKKAMQESQQEDLDAPSLGAYSLTPSYYNDLALVSDPSDTTVCLKYRLKSYPNLTTPDAIAKLMSSFGQTDVDCIVLSMKAPKIDPTKPPRMGKALVPFKQIGDAFAAVCASGRAEKGLEGISVGWVNGKEPPILAWLKKMGKLGAPPPPAATRSESERPKVASLPQTGTTSDGSPFSSFPSSFVRALSFRTLSVS